ncbi:MAG: hypothetical protein OXT72_10380 [Gammaproteobacteria bacterium]|nr:hypothetical protein [Gammaproteobacteria bacterium]MDE0249366.1 hypothetical protein [Gammaproteobacteria bacterium]
MTRESPQGPPRIAILGAGPVGLDAALAALEAGHAVDVYEAARRPAGNLRAWGHVRLFSPWAMNVSPRMEAWAGRAGVVLPDDPVACPTGDEYLARVVNPLWKRAFPADRLHLGTRVIGVGREGLLKDEEIGSQERARHRFRILLRDRAGRERIVRADLVLDCTGKSGNPNTLGDGGIPAPGEIRLGRRIRRRIPDLRAEPAAWLGRTLLLAGGGHSAQTVARDFAEIAAGRDDTRLLWVLRGDAPTWGAVPEDPLPGRARLTEAAERLFRGASPCVEALPGLVVDALEEENGRLRVRLRGTGGRRRDVRADEIVSLTGGVGDHTLYRQLQVHECYATAGPMKLAQTLLEAGAADCLQQTSHGIETLRNPEPGFFLLGDKSYGRNSAFLLTVGWEQVTEVFGELARRR